MIHRACITLLLALAGCVTETADTPRGSGAPVDACVWLGVPAPGPLAAERTKAGGDPVAIARVFIREARLTGDAGFYTLSEQALDCALSRAPDDVAALRLQAHLGIQFHRFARVEEQAAALTRRPDATWLDHALLGDALMEQGELDAAAVSYQHAVDLRPGLEVYDRIGWLRWLWGDVDGALEMAKMAAAAGSPLDPEPFAWALTRLGWLHALRGAPAPELDQALALLPDYPPARLARGRVRLHAGHPTLAGHPHPGAAEDLRAAGATVEAVWALSELDPAASVEKVSSQDPRGYAMWLTPKDPGAALAILEEEWKVRQDATTRMARAYAAWSLHRSLASSSSGDGGASPPVTPPLPPSAPSGAGASPSRAAPGASSGAAPPTTLDPAAEARAALATGIVEPRVLRMGARILGDDALWERALAMGPGLLPSERRK